MQICAMCPCLLSTTAQVQYVTKSDFKSSVRFLSKIWSVGECKSSKSFTMFNIFLT